MVKVDIHSDDITVALNKAPVYEKVATVHAVQVKSVEHVVTQFGDFVETEQDAQVGEWIVTNPDGEKYVLPNSKFILRYEATDVPNIFKAIGSIRAICNPFNVDVEILAPWGSPQFGDALCWFAVSLDVEGNIVTEDRYLIESDAFVHTYSLKSSI